MSQYQEQPDDGLTEEERAALAIVEDATEETTSEETDVNQEEQPTAAADDEQPTGEGEPAAALDPAAGDDDAPAAAAAELEPEPAAKAEPVAPQVTQAPILVVQAPEDAQAKLAEIAAKKAETVEKFEAGDLTGAQYHAEIDKLNEQQFDIKLQLREAELAQKMEAQRIQNVWINDCNAFIGARTEYKDEARLQQLDEAIKALARMPSNANLSNQDALMKAHRMVRAMNGEAVDDAPAAQAVKKTAPPPTVKKPEIVPNITQLPAAATADTSGGEFAALEQLRKSGNVVAFEEALDNLPSAARERYLRA